MDDAKDAKPLRNAPRMAKLEPVQNVFWDVHHRHAEQDTHQFGKLENIMRNMKAASHVIQPYATCHAIDHKRHAIHVEDEKGSKSILCSNVPTARHSNA